MGGVVSCGKQRVAEEVDTYLEKRKVLPKLSFVVFLAYLIKSQIPPREW